MSQKFYKKPTEFVLVCVCLYIIRLWLTIRISSSKSMRSFVKSLLSSKEQRAFVYIRTSGALGSVKISLHIFSAKLSWIVKPWKSHDNVVMSKYKLSTISTKVLLQRGGFNTYFEGFLISDQTKQHPRIQFTLPGSSESTDSIHWVLLNPPEVQQH